MHTLHGAARATPYPKEPPRKQTSTPTEVGSQLSSVEKTAETISTPAKPVVDPNYVEELKQCEELLNSPGGADFGEGQVGAYALDDSHINNELDYEPDSGEKGNSPQFQPFNEQYLEDSHISTYSGSRGDSLIERGIFTQTKNNLTSDLSDDEGATSGGANSQEGGAKEGAEEEVEEVGGVDEYVEDEAEDEEEEDVGGEDVEEEEEEEEDSQSPPPGNGQQLQPAVATSDLLNSTIPTIPTIPLIPTSCTSTSASSYV